MSEFRLDPQVARYMEENGCDEEEAANQLGLNWDEIWDVIVEADRDE